MAMRERILKDGAIPAKYKLLMAMITDAIAAHPDGVTALASDTPASRYPSHHGWSADCSLSSPSTAWSCAFWPSPLSGSTTMAYASKTGGMAEVMVRPVQVALVIHATSASVPIRHVLPSLATRTMPSA